MVGKDKYDNKNTGMLKLGKIYHSPTKNPIDKWKNELRCCNCDRSLKIPNSKKVKTEELAYVYLVNSEYCYPRLDIEFSLCLSKGDRIQQLCINCYRSK